MLNFTPLRDIILVRPDPKITRIGLIWLPDGSTQAGHEAGRDYGSDRDAFTGTVVAVGPGDKKSPWDYVKCWKCGKKRTVTIDSTYSHFLYHCGCPGPKLGEELDAEEDAWRASDRYPMYTKVGDRVIYPRRPTMTEGEAGVMIEGEMYMLFHEEQSCFAVIEA